MANDSKLKILNIISGAKFGGAESFFERLAISFEKNSNIKQKLIIRADDRRYNLLKENIKDIKRINFFKIYNFFFYFNLQRIINEFKPHIVLSWMNRASSMLPNSKIVNEITVGRLGGFYKIKNYAKCDYLITNTQDIKEYVISKGWNKQNVEFIPNFVSQNKDLRKEKKLEKNKILLCMGRFHENKAIDILIKAMPFLTSFSLVIVGSGSLKASYESLIKKFKLSDRVKIFGWSNNISKFINSSSVLICPSRHEPFGNIVVDGWAHKIPVIVSDIGGPGKMIKNKINGIKFEKDNIFDLVAKIKDLDSNSNLRKKIIKNGFQFFKENYSEKVIVEKYIKFFERIKKSCVV